MEGKTVKKSKGGCRVVRDLTDLPNVGLFSAAKTTMKRGPGPLGSGPEAAFRPMSQTLNVAAVADDYHDGDKEGGGKQGE